MTDINASLRDILNTQGKGFSTMLAGIQMGVGKIEASLQRGRERRQQLELIDYQYNKQIEKYKETIALQRDADREQREELKKIELEKARIAAVGKVQEKLIETEAKAQEEREKSSGEKIKETIKQINVEQKAIDELFTPLIKIGFNPNHIPKVDINDAGKIVYGSESETFESYQDAISRYAPMIQFANRFGNIDTQNVDLYTGEERQGTTVFFGREKYVKHLAQINSGSEEGKVIAERYMEGIYQPKLTEKLFEQGSEVALAVNLQNAVFSFDSIANTHRPGLGFSVQNTQEIINIIDEKLLKESDATKVAYYTAQLSAMKKAQAALSAAMTLENKTGNAVTAGTIYHPGVGFKKEGKTSEAIKPKKQ